MHIFDREPPQNLDTSASVSPRGLLGALKIAVLIIGALAAFIVLVAKTSARFTLDFDATFWIGTGALLLFFTLLRPWWFWSHPKALFVRAFLGDTATLLLYLTISGGVIVVAVRRQVAITHARENCEQLLAAAKNTHAKVMVLYGNGANRLPHVDKEPRAFTCERLLEAQ